MFLQSIVPSNSAARCPGRLDDAHLLEDAERAEGLVAEAIDLDCAPPSRVRIRPEPAKKSCGDFVAIDSYASRLLARERLPGFLLAECCRRWLPLRQRWEPCLRRRCALFVCLWVAR